MDRKGLTIVIPTFNRHMQLENQLKLILKSDMNLVEEIIIIDNHSDYDVEKLVDSFNSNKIRLIFQPFNVKVHNNIAFSFFYVQTEWFWLLSDDDEIEDNSLLIIKQEIDQSPSDVGMIKFARKNSPQKKYLAQNLTQFIDYYYDERNKRSGDLVFISTNVYNINRLKNYLGYAFEYAYTYVPHLIPIIKALENSSISVKFSDKCIVKYLPPREGNYSFATVGKGLSTLSHIPINVDNCYKKKFLDCTMSITYDVLIKLFLRQELIVEINDLNLIYNNIYRYYLPFHLRLLLAIFIQVMKFRPIRETAIWLRRIVIK